MPNQNGTWFILFVEVERLYVPENFLEMAKAVVVTTQRKKRGAELPVPIALK